MSKNSKPGDRWRQVFSAEHDRPTTWCKSCGYWSVVNGGAHRADCALTEHDHAVQLVRAVLGGHIIDDRRTKPP
jgi:hypothetical protein